jgi:formylglycine-generating enzyme
MRIFISSMGRVALLAMAVCSTLAQESDKSPAARAFVLTIPKRSTPPGPTPEGMVWIPGGEFAVGSDGKCDGKYCCSPATVAAALPIHRVYVDGFWMDATVVTNAAIE